MASKPVLSIVTVVYNNLAGLEVTYNSLAPQLTLQDEWIVVDGGSTDGTVEFLRRLNQANLTWSSEQDLGIYDAMNKGAYRAKGTYLLFLNSGDELLPLALAYVHGSIFYNTDVNIHAYKTIVVELDRSENAYHAYPDQLGLYMSICHSSSLIPRSAFLALGGYNLAFKLASDYDLLLRAHLGGYPFIASDFALSRFHRGGISDKMLFRSRLEAICALWINNSPRKIKGTLIIVRELLYAYVVSALHLIKQILNSLI